jgi:uncharacterized protein
MTQIVNTNRIEVVDALRGFAIMAIMLLHNLEHFDFYFFPEHLPPVIKALDGYVWSTIFFLFAGKAYAIFALLFGFSFFIMDNNQRIKGYDFRGRFMWRMLILIGFGLINSIIFEGDILTFYAVLSFSLILVSRLNTRTVFIIAAFLLIQPFEWIKFFWYLSHPGAIPSPNLSDHYFGQAFPYLSGSSFWELAKGNFINGRIAVFFWSWEVGRFFQAPGLFMLGMLLGRHSLFIANSDTLRFWKRILIIAIIAAIPFFLLKNAIYHLISEQSLLPSLSLICISIYNLAFTFILISSFILAYQTTVVHKILSKLNNFGKMSLTNYLIQSLMGSLIYYGFALGMYQYTGATYCLIIGIVLFVFQLIFCNWWMKHHQQGPLEYLWHKATWIGRHQNQNTKKGHL